MEKSLILPPDTGVMLCGHGSRNQLRRRRIRRAGRAPARAAAGRAGRIRLSRIRQSGDPPGPRQAARGGRQAHPRRARHAVRRRPRQERHPLRPQHLCRQAPGLDHHLWPRTRRRPQDAARRRRPHPGGASPPRPPRCRATKPCCSSSAAAPPIPTPIPTSPRSCACSGRAWASAGARWPIPASPSRWSPRRSIMRRELGYRRIIVFPYFLFTGVLVKRIYDAVAEARAQIPADRVPQRALSQRPSAGRRDLRRPHPGNAGRPEPDELRHVQVPRAGAGLRGRSRPRAGEPPPPCRRHRRRAGKLPLQGRLRQLLPRRGLLQEARPALDPAPHPRPN